MAGGQIVTAPNGERWRVGRRWTNRSFRAPWLRRDKREDAKRDGENGGNGSDVLSLVPDLAMGGIDDILGGILFIAIGALVAALFAFVVLPLLGLALELALLVMLFTSGLFGRVALGRPWTIEAVNLDAPERRKTYAVKGWRRSGRVIAALTTTIATTGPPQQVAEAETLPAG